MTNSYEVGFGSSMLVSQASTYHGSGMMFKLHAASFKEVITFCYNLQSFLNFFICFFFGYNLKMEKIPYKNLGGRPTKRQVTKPHLLKAIKLVGGVGKLADNIGVGQTNISMWLYTDRKIPAQHVKLIVKATDNKVKPWQLRPDVFEKKI